MYPDRGDKLIGSFFEEWKKHSFFLSLLSPPPLLIAEFGEDWLEDIKKIISDSPLTYFILLNIAEGLSDIKGKIGYNNIISRLKKLNDIHSIIPEIMFISLVCQKIDKSNIFLEHSFKTNDNKNPELKILNKDREFFFEVTSINDFKEMKIIINYFNMFVGVIYSLNLFYNKRHKMVINFREYPDVNTFKHIYNVLNHKFMEIIKYEKIDLIGDDKIKFDIYISKGFDVIFNFPDKIIEEKIKDKIDSKISQLTDDGINSIIVDTSLLPIETEKINSYVKNYFTYMETPKINSVILMNRKWLLESGYPEYKYTLQEVNNPQIKSPVLVLEEIFT
jgi:hypothetical protein